MSVPDMAHEMSELRSPLRGHAGAQRAHSSNLFSFLIFCYQGQAYKFLFILLFLLDMA